ncbi:golgin subfamily A member 1 isoform X1 [Pelobates cultripes]|uniref:Golgin subfamily A member 1 n=2 Tax=Pelobates cultripes TaxID=61616 RepID=A0AAD1WP78_PELCU|nr:golgin subfamily A member 1 isoform X1 [Pelobates cultripes]
MFTKLKKKIAEEAAISPRPGGAARIPRTISKESITSAGADSGDDFASDGSSSRDDLSSQISRKNEQIRRLEAKLSDYAEQVRNLQRMKEKLEGALEKYQDSSMRKLQEQNEAYQASRAKMADELLLALEKKDQEWMAKLADLEEEKQQLSDQLDTMKKQSISLFQKREDLDELGVFQQQEMAKIKHMLLKKEELLNQVEKDLDVQKRESAVTCAELQKTRQWSEKLKAELDKLQEEHSQLTQQRMELTTYQEGAEKKITELENRQQELQDFIQQLSLDLQKTQSSASGCEKRLGEVQADYEDLKVQHEQLKAKIAVETGEKDALITRLQDKVSSLERMLEGSYSGEEGLQELLKEKGALEMRLDETRQQLLEARTLHTDSTSRLENEVTKLSIQLEEAQGDLQQKESEFSDFRELSSSRLKDLEQTLQSVRENLHRREEELNDREAQIKSLQAEMEAENNRLTQQLHNVRQQFAEKVERFEAQILALEGARDFDKTAAQHKISQLEQENEVLTGRSKELETALNRQEVEQAKMKDELSSRETVCVEIAKALEETRKQKEELQQQVASLNAVIEDNTRILAETKEELEQKDKEIAALRGDYDNMVSKMQQLQSDLENYKSRVLLSEESAEKQSSTARIQLQELKEALLASESQVSSLQEEVSTQHDLLHGRDNLEHNGEIMVGDIAQLQKEKRVMEQQISEKNKTIKQLQQRMAELKKTLQKELKIKPEPEINEMREKLSPELATPALTVTNNSDLNDSREINFEYLKHVVLKFMSAREAEAFHLIKAVSVLLNFSVEEENLVKETLEYKMSWFGSKPAPKGSIRPSISKPRTPWS